MHVTSREHLARWLDAIANDSTLIAPCDIDGTLLYRPVSGSQAIAWGFQRPVLSAKEALFPPTERLMTITKHGQQVTLNPALPDRKQVVFGIRPCDARGMQALDALFIDHDPADTCYTQRRVNTVLIGLACREMGESCFCTSVGGAPDDPTGLDIMLAELDDGYAVQAITEAGHALLENLAVTQKAGTIPPPQRNTPITPLPSAEQWPASFGADYWDELAERCLSCRVCAYVCPTCRCFDVRDEPLERENGQERYERIRCWDSCASTAYRQIAGRHNPRAAKGSRLRNRFLCKFYYYPEQYGPVACTGCGRCVDACPVNIDITEVMQQVAKLGTAEVQP